MERSQEKCCRAVPRHEGFEGRRVGPVAVRVSWLEF